MALHHLDFESVAPPDLQVLIEQQVPESDRMEYKSATYGRSEADRREFLKDLSALANSHGGDLLIGISAPNGWADELIGISSIEADQEMQRLQQMANAGIEPRIPAWRMRPIRLDDNRSVLLLRVPKSWRSPHRVTVQNVNRFYLRHAGITSEASMDELRAMFSEAGDSVERAKSWHRERVAELSSGISSVPINHNSFLLLHLIPLASLIGRVSIDPRDCMRNMGAFRPMHTTLDDGMYNFDGFVSVRSERRGYTQVFRDGKVEAVLCDVVADVNGSQFVPGIRIDRALVERVHLYVGGLQALAVPPPVLVLATLWGTAGVQYHVRIHELAQPDFETVTRNLLTLPVGVIDEYGERVDSLRAVRPAIDALWNLAGHPACPLFDERGDWLDLSR